MNHSKIAVSDALCLLLEFSNEITQAHIAKRGAGPWEYDSQIARMHEEVSEVYRALRKGEGIDRVVEECIDSIMSSLTLLSLIKARCDADGATLNHIVTRQTYDVVDKLRKRAGLAKEGPA